MPDTVDSLILDLLASIRRAKDLDAYRAKDLDAYITTVEKTRWVQVGISGRYNIARTASSDLTDFTCVPPNPSFFCDRRVDAQIARARKVEATDAAAAVRLWAKIERGIVDLAPSVPMFKAVARIPCLETRWQLPVQPRVEGPVRSVLGAIARVRRPASSSRFDSSSARLASRSCNACRSATSVRSVSCSDSTLAIDDCRLGSD
jgi:hypothetical protein